MNYRLKVSSLLVFVLSAVCLFGQSTTQTIQGIVTDTTGASIAGAKVTATNQGTNVSQSTTTNESGNYTFPLVPVGDYTVKCEVTGFKTESVRNIRVETAAQVRQDFKLTVG
ncbi:MAG: carboxypeptidase regulatory-like domain-containing protein, partial [Bryobacterales bacterium]|nr:carboxypeptidase regulatory-like domain-containing protein [Bryobacterales bacterium]